MKREQALFLVHRIPYPPDKGDKIRSWRILERLTQRFDTHLAAFVDDEADFAHEPFLKSRCASVTLVGLDKKIATLRSSVGFLTNEPLTRPYYRDPRMQKAVAALRQQPLALEMAFSSSMSQYLEKGVPGRPRIVDLCDADSLKWREYATQKSWPMSAIYAREGEKLAREETRVINWADATFAVSEEEALLLSERDDAVRAVEWFGNGVDTDYFAPGAAAPASDRADIVFVGAMDYWANVDAVLWFMREVWPTVRSRLPDTTFAVVGSKPHPAILALDGVDGVRVTGRVPDVRPYLAGARIAVAPMRIARGVQNKVLEAMAFGLPVVSTPAGLTGVAAIAGTEAISAASASGIADEIDWLLDNPNEARAIGEAARRRVVNDYQWPAQLGRLDASINRLTHRA
jgi:sugar transferase (PEP-CTERM/EpsH1 system associated)